MKKHRKVGNRTDTNFFTSEFKLTSSQFPKTHKRSKMLSTSSQFKQGGLFNQDSRILRKESKDKRPVIQQLNFLANPKKDDFKIPLSVSKRSISKISVLQRSREKRLDTRTFEDFYEQSRIKQNKKLSVGYLDKALAQRKYKPLTSKDMLKHKLEKTALQKFRGAVGHENDQNDQNEHQISSKKAEELFMILQSARQQKQRGSIKYKKDLTDYEDARHKQVQPSTKQFNKANQTQKQQFQEMITRGKEQILYKKKSQQNNQDLEIESKKESFGSNSEFQSSSEEVSQKALKQKIVKKPSINLNQTKIIDSQKSVKNLEKLSNKPVRTQKVVESVQKIEKADKYKKQNADDSLKEKQQKIVVNFKFEKRSDSPDILASIPQVSPVNKSNKNEVKMVGQNFSKENLQQKHYSEQAPTPLKDKKVQKILTQKHLEELQQKTKVKHLEQPSKEDIKLSKLTGPPKLSNMPNTPKQSASKVNYRPSDIDEDQLQEVQFDNKGPKKEIKQGIQEQVPKKQLPQPGKQDASNKKAEGKAKQLTNREIQPPKIQTPEQNPLQQSSEVDALDELIFFIEKIQDVGQYRLKSKDLYSDKSISNELIQIYKVLSYYMAHQFLFLTKKLHRLLTSEPIVKDYYGISSQELSQLQKSGQLQPQIQNLEVNLQESKKLLKKCYEEAKSVLKKEQQILLLDGKSNYHMKCITYLLKQFKNIYSIYERKPSSETIQKRCCYLIETFCVLKLLNGEEIKEIIQLQEIEDYRKHIEDNKNLLLSS